VGCSPIGEKVTELFDELNVGAFAEAVTVIAAVAVAAIAIAEIPAKSLFNFIMGYFLQIILIGDSAVVEKSEQQS
jgi:F0F1-type ATP synthase assembly protein I